MWNYNNELYHYGVLGMKWGVRKDKAISRDINSLRPYAKTGIKTKSGRVVLTSKDVQSSIRGLENIQKKRQQKRNAKAARIQSKIDKRNAKYDQKMGKIFDARSRNRKKLSNKYDAKIAKSSSVMRDVTKQKKAYKLADFDAGTKMIRKGANHYKSINSAYAKTKISAINNPSESNIKKYKAAGKNYYLQRFIDISYDPLYTTLIYTNRYANK